MKNVTITPDEFTNFIKLAKQCKEKFQYVVVGTAIVVTASIQFLTEFGYL